MVQMLGWSRAEAAFFFWPHTRWWGQRVGRSRVAAIALIYNGMDPTISSVMAKNSTLRAGQRPRGVGTTRSRRLLRLRSVRRRLAPSMLTLPTTRVHDGALEQVRGERPAIIRDRGPV